MKKVIALIVILILTSCNSSEKKRNSKTDGEKFVDFVNLFYGQQHNKIPDSLAMKYLRIDSSKFHTTSIWTVDYSMFGDNVNGLIYKTNCAVSDACDSSILITTDNIGRFLDKLTVGYSYFDNSVKHSCDYRIETNKIILSYKETRTTVNQLDDIKEIKEESYTIDSNKGLIIKN